MSYCPTCRQEYEQGITKCTDCGAALVTGTMPRGPVSSAAAEEKWAVLMRVGSQETAEIILGLLESNGFECELVGKAFSEIPVPDVGTMGRLEIWVPESSVDEARALLNEVREGTAPCRSCGHMSSDADPTCEYCGATLA